MHGYSLTVGYVSARGVIWISSDRDDQRMFLGLNFSILGVLGEGKFCKNFFLCLFFVVIQNNLKFSGVPM